MKQGCSILTIVIALCALPVRAAALPNRPELGTATPIATAKLQALATNPQPAYDRAAIQYSLQPMAEDPLANYERTPLGDWRIPAPGDRNDPWLRLLLFGPKRPVVIDLAVFVDGKSYRNEREAWIDDVLAAAKAPPAPENAESAAGNNSSPGDGTNGTAKASDSGPPAGAPAAEPAVGDNESQNAKAEDPPADDNKPTETSSTEKPAKDDAAKPPSGIATQARQAPTMRDRLMNYLAASSAEVGRDEVHWLVAEWGAGPTIVAISPSLSWQRASVAPLLAYLDQNGDGGLSAAELAQAQDLWKRADANGDDVVDVSEMRRVTDRSPAAPRVGGYSLIVPLDANTDWDELAANIAHVYGTADAAKVGELETKPADVTLRIDFGAAKNGDKPTPAISVVSIGPELQSNQQAIVATNDVISVDIGGDFVEFCAAQPAEADKTNSNVGQVAIGAVIDGNALERLLDRDGDGRFTLRERQELGGILAALDRNHDGDVAGDEIPVPIRLAVTVGPHVHQLLATPAGSARTIAPQTSAPPPPDWFASMDKNNDRDLSRGEFLGTSDQFKQFDGDGDGLLSVPEALKLNTSQ